MGGEVDKVDRVDIVYRVDKVYIVDRVCSVDSVDKVESAAAFRFVNGGNSATAVTKKASSLRRKPAYRLARNIEH